MDRVKEIIGVVKQLPPLSNSAAELIARANSDELSACTISEIIAKDPSIAGQLLRVANSAAFHPTNPINSIQHAVSFLGNRTVMGIMMGYSLTHVYKKPLTGYYAPEGALWRYCLCAAIAARYISRFSLGEVSPELAYTAGLLHAIGKSVLSDFLAETEENLDNSFFEDDIFIDTENKLLGVSHPEVGEAIARHWKLPGEICACIKWYHHPESAPDAMKNIVYIVHLGSFVAMMSGKGTGIDAMHYKLDEKYDQYLNLTKAHELERVVINVQEEFKVMATVT